MIDWIQDLRPEQWSAIGTMLTAAIALVAAWFVWRQVGEARRLREAQSQPFVIVHIEPSSSDPDRLEFVVENIGQTLARDVIFSVDPPLVSKYFESAKDADLNESVMFRDGFAFMPPGMRVARTFEYSFERDPNDGLPWKYKAVVQFSDYRGRPQDPLSYVIDLLPLTSGGFVTELGVHDIAKNIAEVREAVDQGVKGIVAALNPRSD